jgi:cell wall-associated NlpC family hydrolase
MATRRLTRAVSLLATAVLSITAIALVPGTGAADPDLSIEEVQQRVDALYEEAEAATERAHTISLQVDDARASLERIRDDIARQEREFDKLHQVIADVAADMYASGGIDPSMQMMFSTEPHDFLLQAQSLDQVMRSQDADLRRAESAALALEQSKVRADQELARLRELEAEAQKEKDQADAKLSEAEELLSRLKREERERLAELQAQRAEAAAATARNYSAPAPAPTTTTSGSGRGVTAANFARAQVGKPYVFGAAGPSAFDCSGLTMAAWGQVGVYLPHAASGQYAATSRVDSGSLMPGDLVFFYSDLHHVGIYVGGGMFVHAANPGDGVVMEGLFSSYWQSVYMGAGRV